MTSRLRQTTAAFSGKLYDGTAVKATVPVIRWRDEGPFRDYSFAPFPAIAKDGTVYCFNEFYCWDGGYVEWVAEHGEDTEDEWSDYAEYASAADLAAKAEEGISQLRRYAADPTVSALSAGTRLHLILYQFQGMELIRLEEIAESGR